MRKFLLVVGLVVGACGTHSCVFGVNEGSSDLVRLPDRQEIVRRIRDVSGFKRFAEKSTLSANLANKEIPVGLFEAIVAVAVHKYIKTLKSPIASVQNSYNLEADMLKTWWRYSILPVLPSSIPDERPWEYISDDIGPLTF